MGAEKPLRAMERAELITILQDRMVSEANLLPMYHASKRSPELYPTRQAGLLLRV